MIAQVMFTFALNFPEMHKICMQTNFCTTPHALKMWENDSIIKEKVQTCDWSCSLQSS